MLQFQSSLLALAAEFTGTYAPFQAVRIEPLTSGGILVAATNKGHVAFLGHDPKGIGDQARTVIAAPELIRACKGIKTAERYITIEGSTAQVTTRRKTTSASAEFPIADAAAEFPPLASVMQATLARWSATPRLTETAGRYDAALLEKAIRTAAGAASSIVLSAFDGGPLRLQLEELDALILLVPQTAQPVPPIPQWVQHYANTASQETH